MKKKRLKEKTDFRHTIKIGSDEWQKIVQSDIDNKYNCSCGHIQSWHKDRSGLCSGLGKNYIMNLNVDDLCECLKFRMKDNLVYLLQRYEERLKEKP